ncbi:MAG: ABC transporter substrate-binding protein [Mogibacterium sp.]|nr:ABC transporter substrate-binding protein [Mogibacterium sp.]
MKNRVDLKKSYGKRGGGKRFLAFLCALFCMAGMTGCTTFDNFRHTFFEKDIVDEDIIYIGVFEPRSGSLEQKGKEEIRGIELAHSIYNNVKGAKVELIIVDTQSDTGVARSAIQDLIALNPIAIIGCAGEANSMIASQYIQEAGIPMITPSASNPLITQGNPYYFRACMTEGQRGEGLAEYAATELGVTRAAILTIENDSAEDAIADGFRAGMKKYSESSRPIVLSKGLAVEDTEIKGLASNLRGAQAEAIFMPVGLEKADRIFTQLEDAGLTDIVCLGDRTWNSADFVKMMEKHPEIRIAFPSDEVVTANDDTSDVVTTETQRFLAEYDNRYGGLDTPSENVALGYDSYLLLINAINNAESFDRSDVRKALSEISGLRCATGVFAFNEDGNPVRTVNISTISDGQIVAAYVTDETSEAGQIETVRE